MKNLSAVVENMAGVARAALSPRANMTAVLINNALYFAGPLNFGATDLAIARTDMDEANPREVVRTVQSNSKWLNEAQFVGGFETDKFVYFLFREPAVEYINCGKVRKVSTFK